MKQGLHHVTGYLALFVVLLLFLGPIWAFLIGFFGVLLGPIWIGLLLWFTGRAMLVDLWGAITRRL
jgi:hypothetical protein